MDNEPLRNPGLSENEIREVQQRLVGFVNDYFKSAHPEDELVAELKASHLSVIEGLDKAGLQELATRIENKLTYLRGKFPEEWRTLNGLFEKLNRLIEQLP